MKHTCTPVSMVVPFYRTCIQCGEEIEPIHCKHCDGIGAEHGMTHTMRDCKRCKGTGVARWRVVE
jgi:DnaJ-class molecular chaperone